jgi:predicted dehydrogenase
VVAVCVPPAQHAEVVVAALRAGKHVFVEKPLALDLDDCDRMVNEARARGLRVAVGHSLRWHPHVRKLKADVDGGVLGEIRILTTTFCGRADYAGPVPEWRKHPDLGGSTFFEMGVHDLDLWRFLTGREVEEVTAPGTRTPRSLRADWRGAFSRWPSSLKGPPIRTRSRSSAPQHARARTPIGRTVWTCGAPRNTRAVCGIACGGVWACSPPSQRP